MRLNNVRYLLLPALWLALLLSTGMPVSAAPSQQEDDPTALLQKGEALLLQSNFPAAEEAYNAAIAADPIYAPAYAHRCYLHTFQGHYEEAIADCQQAITLAPDEAESYIYLTKAYDWSQDFSAAVETGEQAIALTPENGLAHSYLGEAYLDAGEAESGERAIRHSVTLAPDEPEVQRNLAYLYSTLEDAEAQLAALEEAIRLAPNFAYYRLEMIHYHFSQEAYDQAIDEAQAFLARYADIARADTAQFILMLSYAKQDQTDQARLAAQTLRENYPDSEYARVASLYIEKLKKSAAPEPDPAEALQAQTLFDQAKVKANVGDFAEAILLFQKLVDQYPYSEWADDSLSFLGLIYFRLREYDQTRLAFETIIEEYPSSDMAPTASLYLNKIEAASDQDRDAKALQTFQVDLLSSLGTFYLWGPKKYDQARFALETIIEEYPDSDAIPYTNFILSRLAAAYSAQGRYTEALEISQLVWAWAREAVGRGPYRLSVEGEALNNIGDVYWAMGRYDEAFNAYQYALLFHREIERLASISLNGIGKVYWIQGRYEKALESFREALSMTHETDDRALEGNTLNNIGMLHTERKRYAEALESHQQALAIAREEDDQALEGITLNNVGSVYQALGHYTEALKNHQEALAIAREKDNRALEGTTLNDIGTVYYSQGRYAKALESYQQALAIAQELGTQAREGIILKNIGTVYEAQGRYAEALKSYQQAMDILETVRATAGSEKGRAGFIAQYADLYTRAASLFHQQGQDEVAFFTSERGRARAFLDSLATGQIKLADYESADLLLQWQEADARRQVAQDELARARTLTPPNPDLVAKLEDQLDKARSVMTNVLDDLDARGYRLTTLVPCGSTVLGLSDVQTLLDEQTTLLSYFVLNDETLAFLITRSSFEVFTIEVSRQELTKRVFAFRDLIALEAQQPDEFLARDRLAAAQALFNTLLSPLSPHLSHHTMVIAPHNVLHYLPFAALTDEEGVPLAARYTLSLAPSASVLSYAQANRNPDEGRLLALGNPATDLPPLAFAESEVQAISTFYLSHATLLGPEASEAAFRAAAPSADWIHLAAHGEFNPVSPLFSTLHLAGEPTADDSTGPVLSPAEGPVLSRVEGLTPRTALTSDTDGRLEVHEVYGLDLREANLVVLSACQTKLGELSRGDELVGLTRAFLYAGTPTVVATLWEVDDEATGVLMTAFHRHLQEGMGPAAALRAAQEEVRANEKWSAPYYWAGVQVIGDGGGTREEKGEMRTEEREEGEEKVTPMVVTPEAVVESVMEEAGQGGRWVLWVGGAVVGMGVAGAALFALRRRNP